LAILPLFTATPNDRLPTVRGAANTLTAISGPRSAGGAPTGHIEQIGDPQNFTFPA
jgi:hypothetical protein